MNQIAYNIDISIILKNHIPKPLHLAIFHNSIIFTVDLPESTWWPPAPQENWLTWLAGRTMQDGEIVLAGLRGTVTIPDRTSY